VTLAPVSPDGFYTSITPITSRTRLSASFGCRQKGEERHVFVTARGKKRPAKSVEIVLYHKDVLAEDNDRSTNCDWEVISINASPTADQPPMHPLTMARNFLHKKGGTKASYTARQFAEAIFFWSQHTNVK
jgi:hypothetical protein